MDHPQPMMNRFTIEPLLLNDVDRAYPLVQLMMPEVDRRRWTRFARDFLRPSEKRGILSVRDHRGHIRGLAIFRRQIDLAGPILHADPVLYLDLLDGSAIGLALVQALEEKALASRCSAMWFSLCGSGVDDWLGEVDHARISVRHLRKAFLGSSERQVDMTVDLGHGGRGWESTELGLHLDLVKPPIGSRLHDEPDRGALGKRSH